MQNGKAFSIIELSIVIMIIALLVVAIAAGQKLLKNSELKTAVHELNLYQNAWQNFYIKYRALPGDMSNAYDFFNNLSSCTDDDTNSVSTGCNGNGDAQIALSTEAANVWRHLSLAELIPGSFTGELNVPARLAENVPESVLRSNGYSIFYDETHGPLNLNIYANSLFLGGSANNSDVATNAAALEVQDAYQLDSKLDDGFATTGKFLGAEHSACYTAAGSSPDYLGSTYNLNSTALCSLQIILN